MQAKESNTRREVLIGILGDSRRKVYTVATRAVTLSVSHGGNPVHHLGAVGFGEVDAGESASDAGGRIGFFDFVYDPGAAGIGGGWARVSFHDAERV